MSLPVTNLDDRKFQDIVDEAKRLIPQLCPEWTNHNVSDPGVALIELFAWMTEMTLFRLNQVPDVFYTQMLNLLGFEPFPATAARADLTFWLSAPASSSRSSCRPAPRSATAGSDRRHPGLHARSTTCSISQPRAGRRTHVAPAASTYTDVWDDLSLEHGAA